MARGTSPGEQRRAESSCGGAGACGAAECGFLRLLAAQFQRHHGLNNQKPKCVRYIMVGGNAAVGYKPTAALSQRQRAEGMGFEPTGAPVKAFPGGFLDRCLRPLSHPSRGRNSPAVCRAVFISTRPVWQGRLNFERRRNFLRNTFAIAVCGKPRIT